MYLTASDPVIAEIKRVEPMTTSKILSDLIKAHDESAEKKEMKQGDEYFVVKNTAILDHDFNKAVVDGTEIEASLMSNNKLIHSFYPILVEQKISRIASNRIMIQCDDNEVLLKGVNDILGTKFAKKMIEWGTGASNHGKEYLHPFVDKKGKFNYVVLSAEQIIPVYDSDFQDKLEGVIYYYSIEVKRSAMSQKRSLHKVRYYDDTFVWYFVENDLGEYVPDPDVPGGKKYHWYEFYDNDPEGSKEGKSWGRVPFIRLDNNNVAISDLRLVKTLIDDYDFNVSDMSNNLSDIQEYFYLLYGADKTDLAEFVTNLKVYKAAKAPDGAKIDRQSGEIPYEASAKHLDRLEDNIYIFGMGVNPKHMAREAGTAPSGIALKLMFFLLDMKCDKLIVNWQYALEEFLWFATEFINMTTNSTYDSKDCSVLFTKSAIYNELEQATIAQNSKGIISDVTIVENHPWVEDSQLEQERLEEQRGGIILEDEEEV